MPRELAVEEKEWGDRGVPEVALAIAAAAAPDPSVEEEGKEEATGSVVVIGS